MSSPGARSSSGSHCTSTVPSSFPPFLGPCPGGEGRWQCLLAPLLALPPLTGYLGSFTELAPPPRPLMSFHSALLLARPIWLWFSACARGSCWQAPAKGRVIALVALVRGCAAVAFARA